MAHKIASDFIACHSDGAPTFLHECAREAKRILKSVKADHAKPPMPCKIHPLYLGKKRPVNGCMHCLRYYNRVQYGVSK